MQTLNEFCKKYNIKNNIDAINALKEFLYDKSKHKQDGEFLKTTEMTMAECESLLAEALFQSWVYQYERLTR